jgi:zinc transport system substrate-binding protein
MNRSSCRGLAVIAAVTAMVLVGCGGDDEPAADADAGRLQIVANFYPVAEVATRVGGDRVRVTNLTPVGVEPHDLELTSKQVDRLEDADLVLYLGAGFQPALEDVADRLGDRAIDLTRGVGLQKGAAEAIEAEEAAGEEAEEAATEEHEEHGATDPHFWLDPQLMSKAVDEVADALATAEPSAAASFRANASGYKRELTKLDMDLEQGLAECARSEFVTSHAAFYYLAERYGLQQLPIAGVSPEAEPDADRLATLADQIRAKGITTVFFEELVSPKVAETLARETGAATAVLSPIEGLTQEELDADKDYAAVMRDNLAALRAALGCR